MPYHDRRMAHGHERADQSAAPTWPHTPGKPSGRSWTPAAASTGLSSRATRSSASSATSIGSSVGYITLVHDERIRAGGFFHVSTYYADVISQGMTTNHVWEGLRNHVRRRTPRILGPISPMPYVERGKGAGRTTFMVYGKYDPTMLPELTSARCSTLSGRHGADPRTLELACGHYSLELAPFSTSPLPHAHLLPPIPCLVVHERII